jgi:hypothetical protein
VNALSPSGLPVRVKADPWQGSNQRGTANETKEEGSMAQELLKTGRRTKDELVRKQDKGSKNAEQWNKVKNNQTEHCNLYSIIHL